MKTLIVIAFAAVALFATAAEAQSIEQCATTLMEQVKAHKNDTLDTVFCDILNHFMTWLVDYCESLGIVLTDEMVKAYETIMEDTIRGDFGLCDFNARDIAEKRRRR